MSQNVSNFNCCCGYKIEVVVKKKELVQNHLCNLSKGHSLVHNTNYLIIDL